MKAYEIFDEELKITLGVLLYYSGEDACIIELDEGPDEWTAPLMFTSFIRNKIYTIPRDISRRWIMERVIPNSRQNINYILANHKLRSYDEFRLLELAQGRCSQDSVCIRKIDELPGFVVERMRKNIRECLAGADHCLLCFFEDGTVRRVDIEKFKDVEGTDKIIKNNDLYESCRIGAGGYYITFNDSIDISSAVLYGSGTLLPVSLDDFTKFAAKNILDTTQACELLECSRQNLSYLVSRDRLNPIREEVKGNLYLKGDVIRNK